MRSNHMSSFAQLLPLYITTAGGYINPGRGINIKFTNWFGLGPQYHRTSPFKAVSESQVVTPIEMIALGESRTPDIGGLKMSAFSSGRLPNGVAQMQLGAWKDGFGLIEFFAECRDGTRTMRRALCSQGDAQLRFGDLEISRAGESGLDQGSAFVVRSAIMRRHQSE